MPPERNRRLSGSLSCAVLVAVAWLSALPAGCEDVGVPVPPVDSGVGGDSEDAGPSAGQPDADPGVGDGPVSTVRWPSIAFSEIMYHPVLANDDDNDHEFIELHNPGGRGGRPGRLADPGRGRVHLPRGQHAGARPVPRRRAQPGPAARPRPVRPRAAGRAGAGRLPGRPRRRRRAADCWSTAATSIVDAVQYDDAFPWPLAADAFGAGDGWFEEPAWFAARRPPPRLRRPPLPGPLARAGQLRPRPPPTWRTGSPPRSTAPRPPAPARSAGPRPPSSRSWPSAPSDDPDQGMIRATDRVLVRARLTAGSPLSEPAARVLRRVRPGPPRGGQRAAHPRGHDRRPRGHAGACCRRCPPARWSATGSSASARPAPARGPVAAPDRSHPPRPPRLLRELQPRRQAVLRDPRGARRLGPDVDQRLARRRRAGLPLRLPRRALPGLPGEPALERPRAGRVRLRRARPTTCAPATRAAWRAARAPTTSATGRPTAPARAWAPSRR